jgi:hypothetical protein
MKESRQRPPRRWIASALRLRNDGPAVGRGLSPTLVCGVLGQSPLYHNHRVCIANSLPGKHPSALTTPPLRPTDVPRPLRPANYSANALDKNIPIAYSLYMTCDLLYFSENPSVLALVFRALGMVFAYPPPHTVRFCNISSQIWTFLTVLYYRFTFFHIQAGFLQPQTQKAAFGGSMVQALIP